MVIADKVGVAGEVAAALHGRSPGERRADGARDERGNAAAASPEPNDAGGDASAELEASSGGGGNRTRVRGRTGQSVYKLRLPFRFARRPVGSRPTDGLALLKRRAAGEWLSLGAEPDRLRQFPDLGPSQG